MSAREKTVLFFCRRFFNEDRSFKDSVDDFLEAACYRRVKNQEVSLQPCLSDGFSHLHLGIRTRGLDLVDPNTVAFTGRRVPEETRRLKFMRQILKCMKTSKDSNSSFPLPFFLEVASLTPSLSFSRTRRTERTVVVDSKRSPAAAKRTRLHSFNQCGYISTHASICVHSSSDERFTPSRAYCMGSR